MTKNAINVIITPGDTTGVGPEITAKLLNQPSFWQDRCHLVVMGSGEALYESAQRCGLHLPPDGWELIDIAGTSVGEISYRSLEQAVSALAKKKAHALVTGAISKNRLQDAHMPIVSGHTEVLAALAKHHWPDLPCVPNMAFVYEQFRVLLLTRHVPLAKVSATLNRPDVVLALSQLYQWLKNNFKLSTPRIGVLGVNPHAGEIGGEEEREILMPAMAAVQSVFPEIRFDGPLPADAAFRGFDPKNPRWDAIVAPTHDQGLIPMKLLGGLRAVQVTLGLPFIRTSVSHGTAENITGQGRANPDSLFAALDVALAMI